MAVPPPTVSTPSAGCPSAPPRPPTCTGSPPSSNQTRLPATKLPPAFSWSLILLHKPNPVFWNTRSCRLLVLHHFSLQAVLITRPCPRLPLPLLLWFVIPSSDSCLGIEPVCGTVLCAALTSAIISLPLAWPLLPLGGQSFDVCSVASTTPSPRTSYLFFPSVGAILRLPHFFTLLWANSGVCPIDLLLRLLATT